MKNNRTRMIIEGGIMIALAVILNQIKLFQMPNGGSITLGGYLPLFIYALRWGAGPGILCGALYGIMDGLLNPFFFHPIQVLLDYPLAYGALGLAGLGNKGGMKEKPQLKNFIMIIIAAFFRFLFAVISGVIFFGNTLPENVNPWIASAAYNGPYVAVNTILVMIILFVIWKPLRRGIQR